MIDTIRLIYNWKNVNEKALTEYFLTDNFQHKIKKTQESTDIDRTVEIIEGSFSTFRFWSNYYGLSIEGSLWKFYHGNNQGEFTNAQIISSYKKLKECVPTINWNEVHFTKLHFGPNFIMKNSPDAYSSLIVGNKGKKKSVTYDNSLTVNIGTNSNQMSFYNKTVESGLKSGDNILRIEKRTNSESFRKKYFNSTKPKLVHLLDNLNDLKNIWYEEYCKIEKNYSPDIKSIDSFNTLSEMAISNLGYDECKKIVKLSYQRGVLNKGRYSYCNRRLNELMNSAKAYTTDIEPLVELDQKATDFVNTQIDNQ